MTELYLSDTITRPRLEQRMLEENTRNTANSILLFMGDSTYEANF